jgi:putative flippase GtrA
LPLSSRIRDAGREGGRFLVAGAINTACTFALYWLLLPTLGYGPAYTISFVAGIILSYVLNSVFVFRTRVSLKTAAIFPSVYLVQYLLGLLVLWAWVDVFGLPAAWGVFATVAISLPVTFVMSRWILAPRNSGPEARR